jgi:phage tail-like protein
VKGKDKKPRDPYVHLRFALEIGQVTMSMFTECSAMTIETETFEYAEGGVNSHTHKLPTRTKYGNVTLKRGLDETQELYDWYLQVVSGDFKRRHISIVLYDIHGKRARHWDLMDAYPCKWTGPDLRVDAGAVAVETVEFAHAGLIPSGARPRNGQQGQ